MEGLFTLLILSVVMAITSFVVGYLPLIFALSPSQLRLISSIGMGVLVGTSLIVIIPEGVETLYSANLPSHKGLSSRAADVEWKSQEVPILSATNIPSSANLDSLNVPSLLVSPSNVAPSALFPPASEETIQVTHGRRRSSEVDGLNARSDEKKSDKTKTDKDDHDSESSAHAWIGVALVSGFVLMYLIDKLPEFATSSKQQRPPYHVSLDNLGSGLRRGSSPSRESGLLEPGSSFKRNHSFATTTGLVIHAAADGIALGASTSDTGLGFIIFLAIMVHKAPASFGLTSVLLKQGLSTRAVRAHLLVFSLAAPVGALTTFLFVQLAGSGFSGDESGTRWRTGMLLLFSAGTFLYVAMHTMQENGSSSTSRESPANGYGDIRDSPSRPDKSLRDLVASVVGMILPLFLQIGHAH